MKYSQRTADRLQTWAWNVHILSTLVTYLYSACVCVRVHVGVVCVWVCVCGGGGGGDKTTREVGSWGGGLKTLPLCGIFAMFAIDVVPQILNPQVNCA